MSEFFEVRGRAEIDDNRPTVEFRIGSGDWLLIEAADAVALGMALITQAAIAREWSAIVAGERDYGLKQLPRVRRRRRAGARAAKEEK